jgi:alpha-D-ribose 1-methylphosphonate 5-triphosphate synthase subunit PhnH
MTASATILPGFSDPTGQSQQAFRAVLDGMARPGSIRALARPDASPGTWPPAVAALALTLFDQDTSVWLDPEASSGEAAAYLRFHCGCPLAPLPGKAGFAVILDAASAPPLHTFGIGDPLYPERSATIVLAVEALADGPPLRLTGPGIKSTATIAPRGLPPGFVQQWADNHALYPSGIDVILAAGDSVLALPRTVSIEEA